LQRLAADVEELGVVEAAPKQDGRNMIMVMAPHRGAQPQPARARRSEPEVAQVTEPPAPATT
jgi:translation initiation factor IF-3